MICYRFIKYVFRQIATAFYYKEITFMSRRYELDFCRICACLMVVMLHVAASGWFIDPALTEWKFFNFTDMAMRAGVPLFFMISGALFLEKEHLDIKKFISRNVSRLIYVYFIWSFLYQLVHQHVYHTYKNVSDFLVGVIKGPGHLWFLPAMIIVYLFLPVVHNALKGGSLNPKYILMLFVILTLLTTNLQLLPECPAIIKELCGKINLTYISYLGYMALGFILSQATYNRKFLVLAPFIYFITTVLSALGNQWLSLRDGKAGVYLYGYFSLPVFIQACCIFIFFQCLKNRNVKYPKALAYLSDCTFGIYLLHFMVLDFWQRRNISVSSFHPLASIPSIYLLVLCESIIIISILKKIPLLQKLV